VFKACHTQIQRGGAAINAITVKVTALNEPAYAQSMTVRAMPIGAQRFMAVQGVLPSRTYAPSSTLRLYVTIAAARNSSA